MENFCPSDILQRLLPGGGRRLSDKLQEAASNPLCRTLKGGAGNRTKCGWEVSKASEDSGFTDLSLQLVFDFSLGDGQG